MSQKDSKQESSKPFEQQVEWKPAIYNVEIDPPEATVTIENDEGIITGSGKQRQVRVDHPPRAGHVVIAATCSSYKSAEQWLIPKPGAVVPIQLKLDKLPDASTESPSVYNVDVEPPWATLIVQDNRGVVTGTGKQQQIRIEHPTANGHVVITAVCDGYKSSEQWIVPKPGAVTSLQIHLERFPEVNTGKAKAAETPSKHASMIQGKGTASASNDAERTITYSFVHAKDCNAFAMQGAHKIRSGGGLKSLRHAQGTPNSRAVTTQHFTSPITIQYQAYCLPDGLHDIWAGFACLYLHYGTWFNARTALYLGNEEVWLPHDKIIPNHVYQIVLVVDEHRMLTITKDGKQIVQRKLDDNLELSGPVVLGAGLGHVVYKSVTIKGVPTGDVK